MAEIKYTRAKEAQAKDVPYNDGQVIVTDGGGMYVDFPYNNRVKIGNDAISTNLLSNLPPQNMQIEFSNRGTGMRCLVLDNNANNLATQYYIQNVPTTWSHQHIAFTTKNNTQSLDIQLRKAVDGDASYNPGEFAFDNFRILSSDGTEIMSPENLVTNGSFEHGSAGWTVNNSYVSRWSIIDRDIETGLQCLYYNPDTSNSNTKYNIILSQDITLQPNTIYRLRFEGCGDINSPQARIRMFNNGNTKDNNAVLNSTYYWTLEAGKQWKTNTITFATRNDTTYATLAISGQTGPMFFDNIEIIECTPNIPNGDFSTNDLTGWRIDSNYVPYQFGTEGTNTYIRTNSAAINPSVHTHSIFLRIQNLDAQPNTQYYLDFDIKRLSDGDAVWENYMTLTDGDKFALMSDYAITTNETPKFGGPWSQDLEYNNILRCTIEKPNNMHFDLSHIGILTSIVSSQGSEITIATSMDKNSWTPLVSQQFVENVSKASAVEDSFKLITCNGLRDDMFKFLRITITFQGNPALVTPNLEPKKNFLKGIRLYGKILSATPSQHLPLKQDVFANAYFDNKIIASQLIGIIDDGNIGWEDLT